MTLAYIVLSALLALFYGYEEHATSMRDSLVETVRSNWGRRLRGRAREALERRTQLITAAAARHHVNPLLVLTTCWLESGLRVRNRFASLCGCQPYNTNDATQAECAARSLRTSLDRCGNVNGAVSRYVWGRCETARGTSALQQQWREHVLRYQRLRQNAEAQLLPASHVR